MHVACNISENLVICIFNEVCIGVDQTLPA